MSEAANGSSPTAGTKRGPGDAAFSPAVRHANKGDARLASKGPAVRTLSSEFSAAGAAGAAGVGVAAGGVQSPILQPVIVGDGNGGGGGGARQRIDASLEDRHNGSINDTEVGVKSLAAFLTSDLKEASNGEVRNALLCSLGGAHGISNILQAFCADESVVSLQSKISELQENLDQEKMKMEQSITARDEQGLKVIYYLPHGLFFLFVEVLLL